MEKLGATSDQVRRLLRLIEELRQGADEIRRWSEEQRELLNSEHEQRQTQLRAQSEEALASLQTEFTAKLEAARIAMEEKQEELEERRSQRSDALSRQRAESIAGANEDVDQTNMVLGDEQERDLRELKQRHEQFVGRCRHAMEQLDELRQDARDQMARHGVSLPDGAGEGVDEPSAKATGASLLQDFETLLQEQGHAMVAARRWPSTRFLNEGWAVLIGLALMGLAAYPLGNLTHFQPLVWGLSVLGLGVTAAVGVWRFVLGRVRRQLFSVVPQWQHRLRRAATTLHTAEKYSARETNAAAQAVQQRVVAQRAKAELERKRIIQQTEAGFSRLTAELEEAFRDSRQQSEVEWERKTAEVRQYYLPQLKQRREFFERQARNFEQEYEQRLERIQMEEEQTRVGLRERWRTAVSAYEEFLKQLKAQPGAVPGWDSLKEWTAAMQPPAAVAVGNYPFELSAADRAWLGDAAPSPCPVLLTFPEQASLILKASQAGRQEAVRILQNSVLHLLASFPPGTVRLTVFDPIGLGENFSGLMHLADYDERLISHRIWTEAAHLQQRLVDISEHMENVIQKYLRNQYASIQEYNRHAGEVAEPFRILVMADCPQQMSEESMRRLIRILQTGPRCGVYTLMSIDMEAKLPRSITLEDLEQHAQVFEWQGSRFANAREPWNALPLHFDTIPPDEEVTELISAIGRLAQENRRVEVPFSWISPAADEWWTFDCNEELRIPLGRSGATQQLTLSLGRGTSQHVLIAGKTGSGKSTLLHALITNGALRYSPDELQFFLVDFKKGVEFKPYAATRLPHAAVVAIESEREFGLSVLQRLDQELRIRGDLYRESGVQNLGMFRTARPEHPMPRMLLVVDEFQEFFVKDDRVAHEASLLLDRLVRQGRAFGIHVILGSQTLAGAYSLARSTLGQMAVRIALECSAADAHVILSEDNTAARLLGRPGEAIYNDANGMLEGNHPFQVVWLPDADRNDYLQRVAQLSVARGRKDPAPIVFEGQAAADLRENSELRTAIEKGLSVAASRAPRAWLGAAVEIKEPISVAFRRQAGTNLLIVGSNQELASGMFAASVLSLALADWHTSHPIDAGRGDSSPTMAPRKASRFEWFSSDSAEDEQLEWVKKVRDGLSVSLQMTPLNQAAARIAHIAEQVDQRLSDDSGLPAESVFLLLNDLGRFRSLQPSADDFGLGSFSSEQASGNAAAQLARILREGPAVGIHAIVWADGYHSLSRWFERSTLRDFGQRVLMQMSAVDSSHLMDSVAASQLGAFRALLHDHDRGHSEKFRPYGVPEMSWLDSMSEQLRKGTSPSSLQTEASTDNARPNCT